MIREITGADYNALMHLYTHLHGNPLPGDEPRARAVFDRLLHDDAHHVIVCEEGGRLVAACVCVVVPNLTHGQRPYALIENVVTHADYRRRGYASSCLAHACALARQAGCYKVMLLTGAKDEGTLHFYERAGFNRQDKTAFIQWL